MAEVSPCSADLRYHSIACVPSAHRAFCEVHSAQHRFEVRGHALAEVVGNAEREHGARKVLRSALAEPLQRLRDANQHTAATQFTAAAARSARTHFGVVGLVVGAVAAVRVQLTQAVHGHGLAALRRELRAEQREELNTYNTQDQTHKQTPQSAGTPWRNCAPRRDHAGSTSPS